MAALAPEDMSETIPNVTSAQSPAWSEVTRISDGSFRVRLGGSFGQGWLASLCRGLADQRISIERAHAMRTRNLSWIAEFTARPLAGAADPDRVPYLALAATPIVVDGQPLRLVQYSVEPCFDGTLKLAFEARDTLGLLGALLAKLAHLGLYPVEMHIDTQTDIACDTLWLGTADGGSPAPELRNALCSALDAAM
ncbi:MAG TPA: hypothetical protein VFZ61_05610 [Polyangiales bacterium]